MAIEQYPKPKVEAPNKLPKDKERKELADKVREFQEKGGKIDTDCPPLYTKEEYLSLDKVDKKVGTYSTTTISPEKKSWGSFKS